MIQEPFNAEPPRSALVSSYVTPVDLFYKRNHGPIPIVDHLERSLSLSLSLLHPQFLLPSSTHLSFLLFLCQTSYSVTLTGLIQNPRKLFIKDIRFIYMLLLSFLDTKYCIFYPSSLYIPPLFPQTAGPSQSTMLLLLYRFILMPLTLLYAHFFHM